MRVIGLTGSIACGKSTVSAYVQSRGFPVIDGDLLSRELTMPGGSALPAIRQAFGPEVFLPDGSLNRRALGHLVFSDPAAREKLDELMAPFLLSLTQERLEAVRASGAALCFLDMPLLFEKGYDRFCDTVWTVWLPVRTQLERLMARDHFTEEEALSRIRAVMSSDEKADRANRVINNSGTPEETLSAVAGLIEEELRRVSAPARVRRSRPSSPPSVPAESVTVPAAPSVPAAVSEKRQVIPDVMERPTAAKKQGVHRKAAWKMPVWLKTALISCTAFLIIGITAMSLMSAYLHRQEEQHLSEQQEIDKNYPLLYRDLIERYAAEYNLAPAFVAAVIKNESSFQPVVESEVGARGLMQLMPDTAEWIARKLGVKGYAFERMKDPGSNIQFGCWYLNYLSKLFLGDPVCVSAAYHAGQGQVKVWLSDPQLSEDGYTMPLENLPEGRTKIYVGRVTRDYGIYQDKYFAPAVLDDSSDDSVL